MGPGRDRTRDPWICSQTSICCQTRYRLRYAARFLFHLDIILIEHVWICPFCILTFYLIETPFNTFAKRADPDQAALVRAA